MNENRSLGFIPGWFLTPSLKQRSVADSSATLVPAPLSAQFSNSALPAGCLLLSSNSNCKASVR